MSVDDLIETFMQTVFASVAIDQMASKLQTEEGFDMNLFRSINNDPQLLSEMLQEGPVEEKKE